MRPGLNAIDVPAHLVAPGQLAGRRTPSRALFGPHATNLCADRAFGRAAAGYYARRAAGGCGVVVTEEASILGNDHPYEGAPLAERCGPGWALIAEAVHRHGTLCVAALGHSGSQGSSAHTRQALWAPSPVPHPGTREMPREMEADDIAVLVRAFGEAAALAVASGCDGVEINAGQYSVLRQFLSPLTNQRDDGYGSDRGRLVGEVLAEVRRRVPTAIVGLRLSCDELAPWAGITPAQGARYAARLSTGTDYLVAVRGGSLSEAATRPGMHTPPGFNQDLCAAIRACVPAHVAVVLQGSVVEPTAAGSALAAGTCDFVEMTRAQIAAPELVARARRGLAPRPCVLCNQRCQVRDQRNLRISCDAEPETEGPASRRATSPVDRDVTVVGGGPAGLEAARTLAGLGHRVTVRERRPALGGALRAAAQGAGRERWTALADWLADECRRLGVGLMTSATAVTEGDVWATGAAPTPASPLPDAGPVVEVSAREALAAPQRLEEGGPAVVWDPVGGPVGISTALFLAARGVPVALLTPDPVVGRELAWTGDLVTANERLRRAGVTVHCYGTPVRGTADGLLCRDVHTLRTFTLACHTLVNAGPLAPAAPQVRGIGDALAPRGLHAAILEGRATARQITAGDTRR